MKLKRIMAGLCLLAATLTPLQTQAVSVTDFEDIAQGEWYYHAVREAVDRGIVYGIHDRAFGPNIPVSRAMFVQMLANFTANSQQDDIRQSYFQDVEMGTWYAQAANWAFLNGIVSGTGSYRFSPEENITREQATTILHAFALRIGADTEVTDGSYRSFADADQVSPWAHASMCWAVKNGILKGTKPDRISPGAYLLRSEAVQLLYNAYRLLGDHPITIPAPSYQRDLEGVFLGALAKPYQEIENESGEFPDSALGNKSFAGGHLFDFRQFPNAQYLFNQGERFDSEYGYPTREAYPYALITNVQELFPELVGLSFSEAIQKTGGALDISYKGKTNGVMWFNGEYYTDHFYYYLALEGGSQIFPDTQVMVMLWSVL